MGIAIRLASLPDEDEQLIEILDRNFPGRPNRKIQRRRYANPLGPGWSWVARSEGADAIIATASCFPRSFWVNGKKVVCAQVIEFAVDAPYRSLGPAVLLQRATLGPANSGEAAFCYDCPPHDRGMSTFVRLGMQSSCDVVRYALLLRSDEYLGKRLGRGAWTRPLVAAANLALRVRQSGGSAHRVEISRQDKAFDEEFSFLDQLAPSLGTVRASRAAEELNWRYLDDPWALTGSSAVAMGEYRVFVARQAGELIGFVIFGIGADGTAWIADLFGRNLSDLGGALLEAVIEVCRRENIIRLDAVCSADNCLRSLLERAGFRARERAYRVVPYEKGDGTAKLLRPDLRWTLSHCEITW